MMIDRRDFIASATLVFVAPAIHLLPSQQPSSAASQSRVVFMIRIVAHQAHWADGQSVAAASPTIRSLSGPRHHH